MSFQPAADATARFASRAEDYDRYRPDYPAALWDLLVAEADFHPGMELADVASGTGISSQFFVDRGCRVLGVEPNAAMRAKAESRLAGQSRFRSVAGTAEATTLSTASVDAIVVAQAFHWLDAACAALEFRRILRNNGPVAIVWNSRSLTGTAFLEAYEAFLLKYGTDYKQVTREAITDAHLARFFAGGFARRTTPHAQHLDREGFLGRLLSSSYLPGPSSAVYPAMRAAINPLFDSAAVDGVITIDYTTEVYVGWLSPRET